MSAAKPLRSFLPESIPAVYAACEEADPEGRPDPAGITLALVVHLTAWAIELSERIDALPLDELAGIGQQLQTHPLLGRILGVGR